MSSQVAVLSIPLLVLVVAFAFDLYCLRDLRDADVVLCFPRQTWFYIIIFATPFGGISYLTIGRPR